MCNFVTACINADALLEEIDDYILQWHEADTNLPVYDYLGMTEEEYLLWLEDDSYLRYVILAHKENRAISDVLSDYLSPRLAARTDSPDEVQRIYNWLARNGKL